MNDTFKSLPLDLNTLLLPVHIPFVNMSHHYVYMHAYAASAFQVCQCSCMVRR